MKIRVCFITGVNGVGKSTLIPHLKTLLPQEKYVVHDFDARGVPDGADDAWRVTEIRLWLEEAARSGEKETIICGFVRPQDFNEIDTANFDIKIIMLYADAETIRTRLKKRYSKDGIFDEDTKVIGISVNQFIENNVWYADRMREECSKEGCPVVDTSALSPDEVTQEVLKMVR